MYILVAILSYFISALVIVLDKFLLSSNRISKPSVYAFYIGILSLVSVLLFPFGFFIPTFGFIVLSLLGGIIFIYGILSLYHAIQRGEASRMAPLAGAAVGIFTYLISVLFLKENLSGLQILGVLVLVIGGVIIASAQKEHPRMLSEGTKRAVLSGFLLAIAFSIFKVIYDNHNFISGFIWTRFGLTLGALSFLLIPTWRKEIDRSLDNFHKKHTRRKHSGTAVLFIGNKIMGGISSILTNWAIALGSVAVVNGLIPVQYAFVFGLASLLSKKWPKIFGEELNKKVLAKKIIAIIIIGIGIILVSAGGGEVGNI